MANGSPALWISTPDGQVFSLPGRVDLGRACSTLALCGVLWAGVLETLYARHKLALDLPGRVSTLGAAALTPVRSVTALFETLRTPRQLVVAFPRRAIDMSLICSTVAVLGILWMLGWLEDIYPMIYQTWPGRQWTHVFRDYKVLYVIGMGATLVVAWFFFGRPKRRKVTGLWSLLVGLAGFLTGHVLWGAI